VHVQALLHKGMTELLRTASDTSLLEPWPRVHAFNVLRLAFNDKNLAVDSSAFFAAGIVMSCLSRKASKCMTALLDVLPECFFLSQACCP
jgi:hypothetical protein